MKTTRKGETRAPWHAGELAMQSSAGVADRMAEVGKRAIRDHLIDQHRQFYPLLPFVVLGAADPAGNAWATLRSGSPGFMQAASPHRLSIRIPRDPGDPADAGMDDGDGVGLLGIDLFTRRRNRLNGRVSRNGDEGFDLFVEQSYGNCPQYIQMRQFSFIRDPATLSAEPPVPQEATDERVRALIQSADTLFVASYVEREPGHRQVDVSHRGGKPGFVRLSPDGVRSRFRILPATCSSTHWATSWSIRRAAWLFQTGKPGTCCSSPATSRSFLIRPRSKTFRALSGFGGSNRTRSSTGPMLCLFAGPPRQRAGRQTRC